MTKETIDFRSGWYDGLELWYNDGNYRLAMEAWQTAIDNVYNTAEMLSSSNNIV